MRSIDFARLPRFVFAILLGGLGVLALWVVLEGATWAASLDSPDTGLDPEIHVSWPANGMVSSEVSYTFEYTAYLPIVAHNHHPFVNGDFEDGLTGWKAERGSFDGHGSGMPHSVVVSDGGHQALLGEPSMSDDSIPVGYGTVAQTFTVDKPYLQLQYWVSSYDIARGVQHYYDTFEVSVNRSPDQIQDTERDSRGCASTVLNPEGTLTVPEDGLIFCGGRPGTSGQGTPWDTQTWKIVTLDVNAFQGTNITLYFTIWSREYEPSYYNDRAWFNTWAYVDNVQLANSLLGTSVPNADSQVLNALAGTEHTSFSGGGDSSEPPRR